MWTTAVLLVTCVHLIPGKTIPPEYKGCYSTSFVNQYDFYYKFNQSMNIEQGFAACNHRLTVYMGLQVDESSTADNFVYCGNDLTEVSPKLDNSECSTCQENGTLSCGGTNSMSVYMLRESTPLAVLLKTERGVELFQDNINTVKVHYYDSPLYEAFRPYHSVNYIFTEDLVLFFIHSKVMRSVYDSGQMQYTKPTAIREQRYPSFSLAVDFITNDIFLDGSEYELIKTDTKGSSASNVSDFGAVPRNIKIDPFNRSLAFTTLPFDKIHIWLLDDKRLITRTLHHLNIEKIIALSMDIQERYLYAIVLFKQDSTRHLVRLDYEISQIRVLFSGPQLADSTNVLEVFRGRAVWVTYNDGGVSVLYTCTLTPTCLLDDLTSYLSTQKIYDFTIYHPEKQTPGRKRLCANMTCSHGCQLFSPFTAMCTCPPRMHLNLNHSTCVWMNSSTQVVLTNSSSIFESSKNPVHPNTGELEDSDNCTYVPKKKYHLKPNLKLNWYAAYMHCRSKGWRLATILNEHQNDDMLAYIRKTYPEDGKHAEGIWIGATDLGQNGTWQWMSTGRHMEFTDWLQGKPNHQVGSEHCLDLWTLKWNHSNCDLNQPFVCEYVVHEPACV